MSTITEIPRLAVDLVIYGNNETWLKNEQIAGLIKKGGILISDFDQSAEELEKSWSKSISTRSSIDDRTGEPNQIPILSASSEGVTKSMPSMNKSIEEDEKKLKNVILKFICS
ncbi:hypothetical protein DRW42_09465 [Pedobacter miscanthi]|uniref:Uncharacterized protein n=1 Tax=Pedobacter miscanthi TaxID=2259170 RepID=A0A366L3V1_9SPHI|nr:hypothetical protein DRW42_09465 [Pedobacter miscanthi]